MDTSAGDWDFRLGKQQVVWGTADGIKLLDIINPTDFRELNQNAMEDSRIPVWMINAETNIGESSNVQLILSQAETNKVAGLWTQDDSTSSSRRSTTTAVGALPQRLCIYRQRRDQEPGPRPSLHHEGRGRHHRRRERLLQHGRRVRRGNQHLCGPSRLHPADFIDPMGVNPSGSPRSTVSS